MTSNEESTTVQAEREIIPENDPEKAVAPVVGKQNESADKEEFMAQASTSPEREAVEIPEDREEEHTKIEVPPALMISLDNLTENSTVEESTASQIESPAEESRECCGLRI